MTSHGLTDAERYLAQLARRTFLSMWSWPNPFYAPGKELADLLVVCGTQILLFQDKWSSFPSTADVQLGWERWFKRTVESGSQQVLGAERRLKLPSTQLFTDPAATSLAPIALPDMSAAEFHLIVVTHGGSAKCKEVHGGSGSLMLNSGLRGMITEAPFCVGDVAPARSFVHVLDDTTLDILMKTLDTITDFTRYLRKKSQLLRSPPMIFAAGEEELLANYLGHLREGQHDFNFNVGSKEEFAGIAIQEGGWNDFSKSPERMAQVEQDKISYAWDGLIEQFNIHALTGTSYTFEDMPLDQDVKDHERIVRFMALEPRFSRRLLAQSLLEALATTGPHQRRIRVTNSFGHDGLVYVFLLFPFFGSDASGAPDYRHTRIAFLSNVCLVAKLRFPNATDIVGIATEPRSSHPLRSEDAVYADVRTWTPEHEASAREFQREFEVLVSPTESRVTASEYPKVAPRDEFLKNPRNKPCPCGSGRKYKTCCLPRGRSFYQE